jgi:hypothetical protein
LWYHTSLEGKAKGLGHEPVNNLKKKKEKKEEKEMGD